MATRTIANAGGNWSSTATWVEVAVPTAADDVVATATSGNLVVDVASACRSIDFTNYVGTFSGSATLAVGTSTNQVSLIAIKFVAGMTSTYTGVISLLGNPGTVTLTCDFNGISFGGLTLNSGANVTWQLAAHGFTVTGALTLTAGKFDSNNFNFTVATLSQGVSTLTLGTSTMTVTGSGASAWSSNNASAVIAAASATITFSNAASSTMTGNVGATQHLGTVNYSGTGSFTLTAWSGASQDFVNLRALTGAATGAALVLASNITVTGTLTVTGNSIAPNRTRVLSSVVGSQRTVTVTTGFALTNANFRDIVAAGAAGTWTGTSLGDAGNNSNITFTGAVTRFRVGAAGNWSDTTHWSTTNGGASGASAPLPQDTATVNGNASGTITGNMADIGPTDFTGFAGTWNLTTFTDVNGNLALAAGMVISGAQIITFTGRGAQTLTMAGKRFAASQGPTFNCGAGTYTLVGNFAADTAGTTTLTTGTLDAATNNVNLDLGQFTMAGGTLNMGSGTWTLNRSVASTIWNLTGGTLNCGTSTIIIAVASTGSRTFAGGGKIYNLLRYTVAGSTGALVVTGSNTFTGLAVSDANNARSLTLTSGTTTTILDPTQWLVNGVVGAPISLFASTLNSQATINCPTGVIQSQYIYVRDIVGTGGAVFQVVATTSTLISDDPGWSYVVGSVISIAACSFHVTDAVGNYRLTLRGVLNDPIFSSKLNEGFAALHLDLDHYPTELNYGDLVRVDFPDGTVAGIWKVEQRNAQYGQSGSTGANAQSGSSTAYGMDLVPLVAEASDVDFNANYTADATQPSTSLGIVDPSVWTNAAIARTVHLFAGTITAVGTSYGYAFNNAVVRDALDQHVHFGGAGWFWMVHETGSVDVRSSTAFAHSMTLGREATETNLEENIHSVINVQPVMGATPPSGTQALFALASDLNVGNPLSVPNLGRRVAKVFTDTSLVDQASVTAMANSLLAQQERITYRRTMRLTGYTVHRVRCGDSVKWRVPNPDPTKGDYAVLGPLQVQEVVQYGATNLYDVVLTDQATLFAQRAQEARQNAIDKLIQNQQRTVPVSPDGTTGTISPPALTNAPNTPTGLAASTFIENIAQVENAAVTATWSASVVDATHAAAASYTLRYRRTGTTPWLIASGVVAGTLTGTVTGLVQGLSYDFQIAAVNIAGTSAFSATTTQVTAQASAPSAPAQPTAALGITSAVIGFTPLVASDIQTYEIWQFTGSSVAASPPGGSILAWTGESAIVNIGGLTTGQTYTFWVRAQNWSGIFGSYSPFVHATPNSVATTDIANLAVTNAKINDLAVDKLTAGTLTAAVLMAGSIKSAATVDSTHAGWLTDATSHRWYDGSGTNYGAPSGAGVTIELKNDGTGFFKGTITASQVYASTVATSATIGTTGSGAGFSLGGNFLDLFTVGVATEGTRYFYAPDNSTAFSLAGVLAAGTITFPAAGADSAQETATGAGTLAYVAKCIISFKPATTNALVKLGTALQGTATSVSPLFGQNTAAGHLLVAWITANPSGGALPTTAAAGWVKGIETTTDNGTATGVTATTLTDTTKTWTTNAYNTLFVSMGGVFATITSNTGTVLTFTGGWSGATPATGPYTVYYGFRYSAIWYKPNCGATETAPVFTLAVGGTLMAAQLGEFSGALTASPVDKTGHKTLVSPSSPTIVATASATDSSLGDLILSCTRWAGNSGVGPTYTDSWNNATPTTAGTVNELANSRFSHFTYGIASASNPTGTVLQLTSFEGLEAVTTDSTLSRGFISTQYSDDATSSLMILRKSRGIPGAQTTVLNGDTIGAILSQAYDGTNWIYNGLMGFGVNGTVAAGSVPSDFTILLGSNVNTLYRAIWLKPDQSSVFPGPLLVPTVAGGTPAATSYGSMPVKLSEVVLAATSTDISFSSIPASFRNLTVTYLARCDTAAVVFQECGVRMNGDSTAAYAWSRASFAAAFAHQDQGNAFATSGRGWYVPAATASASWPGHGKWTFPWYADTTFEGQANNLWSYWGAAGGVAANAQEPDYTVVGWNSTAAINSLDFIPLAGNFIIGSSWGLQAEP